jgi:tRNA (guanine-N(7)-)-methyltransferase
MRVRTLKNPFSCRQRYERPAWTDVFPTFSETLDVEIGFGTGIFLYNYAAMHQDRSIVGIEIKKKLVDCVQKNLKQRALNNVYAVWGNAVLTLEDMFADHSIDRLFIFHPDPWHKSRHHKRRLVNAPFLDLIHQKLKHHARLYLSSDVASLWTAMQSTIAANGSFKPIEDVDFWENKYHTRWHEIRNEKQRPFFCATYEVCKSSDTKKVINPISS